MKLAKSQNLTLLKTNQATSSSVRLARKLAKSLIKTNSKMYEPKTYNKVIDNPIHGNK